jgi:hypothetical protein
MVNSGTAQRFLAELCWFPSAALEPYIQWETVDSSSVKATLTLPDQTVDGIFSFLPTSEIASFETLRYYGSGATAQKERWVINILQHQYFDGYYLPQKIGVTWALATGNFNWLELEVTDLQTK